MRLGAGSQHIYSAVNLSSSVGTGYYTLVYNGLILFVCESTRKGGDVLVS